MTRMLSLLVLLPAAVALTACGPEVSADVAPAPAPAQLTGTPDSPAPIELTREESTRDHARLISGSEPAGYPAVLFSDLDAAVGARSRGIIHSVEVELGDAVRRGQVLARLDDARQLARYESATAARDLSRAEFTRVDSLLLRGFVTRAEHDEALYGLRVAEAVLREAEIELEHMRIVAPFDGVVTRRSAGRGRTAEEGEALFRVTALSRLRALCRVPERDAAEITTGSAAIITTETGAQVDAVVTRISAAVDPGSGTVEVLLDIARPRSLRPGAGATVRFAALPVSSR